MAHDEPNLRQPAWKLQGWLERALSAMLCAREASHSDGHTAAEGHQSRKEGMSRPELQCDNKTRALWISRSNPRRDMSLRMFCFPYAGASAAVYQDWQRYLPAEVDLCLVHLPGRGSRLAEPCCQSVDEVMMGLMPELLPLLDRPFVLYGHSMGALLAFVAARRLRQHHALLPVQLMVSSSSAPQIPNVYPPLHTLPDREFIHAIIRLNGTPTEILENDDCMSLMLPIMRADFGICNRYEYSPEAPLACPISVFGGIADTTVAEERLEAWRQQTSSDFSLQMFPGDHFFLRSAQRIFLGEVVRKLQLLCSSGRQFRH